MTTEVTASLLQAFLRDELLNGRVVGTDEDLLLSGLLDSLGVMALVAYIEKTQSATIPPGDVTIENFANLDAIVGYLKGA